LNQLVDFYDIQYGGHATDVDLVAILFNPVTSTIPKWQTETYEVDAKPALVNMDL
jgi:hypothetical protein